MKLLIKNGRVVHPVTGTVVLQDILAENGRIVLMERGLDGEADRVRSEERRVGKESRL